MDVLAHRRPSEAVYLDMQWRSAFLEKIDSGAIWCVLQEVCITGTVGFISPGLTLWTLILSDLGLLLTISH